MTPDSSTPSSSYRGRDADALPDYGQPAYELPDHPERGRARKRGVRWGWLLGSLAGLFLILLIAAEFIARLIVGAVAASEIEESMPEGVEATVSASTTGWCVLCELVSGELSGLDVEGENVEFGGARGSIDLHANSVTLTDPISVGAAEGTVRIGEASLNRILADTTAQYGFEMQGIDLNDGSFGFSSTIDVLGAEIRVEIEASVRIQSGGRIQIIAENLAVQSGSVGTDIPVDPDRFTLEFCVAEYLPEMLEITAVRVVDDGLEVGYRTTSELEITEEAFQTRGSCGSG